MRDIEVRVNPKSSYDYANLYHGPLLTFDPWTANAGIRPSGARFWTKARASRKLGPMRSIRAGL